MARGIVVEFLGKERLPRQVRALDPGEITPSDLRAVAAIISQRDAVQRCLQIRNPKEAVRLFVSAVESGDGLLRDALVAECHARNWVFPPVDSSEA